MLNTSCTTDEQCRKNTYVNVGVSFYKISLKKITKKDSISVWFVDSLTLVGLDAQNSPLDSILYSNRKSVNKLILPLNKFAEKTRFLITLNKTTDTITVYHKNLDQYLSLECGCIKVHEIDSIQVTKSYVDSINLRYKQVNTTNAEHIQIFHSFK